MSLTAMKAERRICGQATMNEPRSAKILLLEAVVQATLREADTVNHHRWKVDKRFDL